MSEERFRLIRSALDDEPFSGLFDAALVRSFPYRLP
jgi:hypothetical protein